MTESTSGSSEQVQEHLRAALERCSDERARYHIRAVLQRYVE